MYRVYVIFVCLVTFLISPLSSLSQKDTTYFDFSFDISHWVEHLDDTVSDIHGNSYGTLKMGDQIWMDRNLHVTKFNDGTEISKVKGSDLTSADEPKFSYGPQHVPTQYYNYYVAQSNQVCPSGWKVPTSEDWKILLAHFDKMNDQYNPIIFLDSGNVEPFEFEDIEGVDIREFDSLVVIIKNHERSAYFNEDALFFTGSLDGYINQNGQHNFRSWAYWWCSDSVNYVQSWYGAIDRPFGPEQIWMKDERSVEINPAELLSIRCIKDDN